MIKVIDEVTGTAIKIEVIGRPWQYQVRIGKVGTWTVSRGRTAGQVKTGEKWGHPMFYGRLDHALQGVLQQISEDEGLPKEHLKLAADDRWQILIEEENRRITLIDAIHKAYQELLETNGKDLAGLSKLLAKDKVEANIESDDEDENEESEIEE